MREIIVKLKVNEKEGKLGIMEDFNNLGFEEPLDRIIYALGIYNYLANLQLSKLHQAKHFNMNIDEDG